MRSLALAICLPMFCLAACDVGPQQREQSTMLEAFCLSYESTMVSEPDKIMERGQTCQRDWGQHRFTRVDTIPRGGNEPEWEMTLIIDGERRYMVHRNWDFVMDQRTREAGWLRWPRWGRRNRDWRESLHRQGYVETSETMTILGESCRVWRDEAGHSNCMTDDAFSLMRELELDGEAMRMTITEIRRGDSGDPAAYLLPPDVEVRIGWSN